MALLPLFREKKKPWSRVGGQIPAKPAANC